MRKMLNNKGPTDNILKRAKGGIYFYSLFSIIQIVKN